MRIAVAITMTVIAMALLAEPVQAQYHHGPPSHRPREIRCESRSRESRYCPTGTVGRVRLERRLSKTPCREYDTWGADRDGGGVWVWDGCRAVFSVWPWGGPPGHGYGPQPVKVRCKSKDFKPNYCPLPRWGRVQLEKRHSGAPCRQYDTWGMDGGGIWVDRGCDATFVVR